MFTFLWVYRDLLSFQSFFEELRTSTDKSNRKYRKSAAADLIALIMAIRRTAMSVVGCRVRGHMLCEFV